MEILNGYSEAGQTAVTFLLDFFLSVGPEGGGQWGQNPDQLPKTVALRRLLTSLVMVSFCVKWH